MQRRKSITLFDVINGGRGAARTLKLRFRKAGVGKTRRSIRSKALEETHSIKADSGSRTHRFTFIHDFAEPPLGQGELFVRNFGEISV